MGLNEYQISNLNVYISRMQKSVLDKMFFMDKVFEPFTNIVDFGCADGELMKVLHMLFGEYRYIGYDISDDMIRTAKGNVPFAELYSDWDEIGIDFTDSLLNISSTLHEVYSYSTKEEIEIFWKRVFESGFKYITIRDMMLSKADMDKAQKEQLDAVVNDDKYADKRCAYEDVWGKIETQRDLVHYLLKYRYTENWTREVRENYVPLTIEQLLKMIPEEYEITYMDHFTLAYTAWQIKKDFNIDLKTPTHIKIILKRKS